MDREILAPRKDVRKRKWERDCTQQEGKFVGHSPFSLISRRSLTDKIMRGANRSLNDHPPLLPLTQGHCAKKEEMIGHIHLREYGKIRVE